MDEGYSADARKEWLKTALTALSQEQSGESRARVARIEAFVAGLASGDGRGTLNDGGKRHGRRRR